MKTGEKGVSLIKKWEGLGPEYHKTGKIVAYLCANGKPTIGYGHTKGITRADVGKKTISMAQANKFLEGDLKDSEDYISRVIKAPITQNQFDALVSGALNLGSFGPTIIKIINAERHKDVPAQIRRYIHATNGDKPCKGRCGQAGCKGRIFDGLITRRAEEAELYKG